MGSLYGFEIESELPLRRLNASAGTRGTLALDVAPAPLVAPAREPDGVLEDERDRWYASYELEDGGCLLQLPPTGSFLLDPAAGRVAVDSVDGDLDLLEHRIASSAICTLLSLRDDLALHAAGVEAEGRALVFCGPTQRGKSTLVRALGDAGLRLFGEDGLAIELGEAGPVVHPGARGVRVRGHDQNGRRRTDLVADPGSGEPGPGPVGAIVLLGERGAELELEALEPARALALLTPNLIHSGGRGSIATAFQRLAALLGAVPAFSASLADDLDALPANAERLLDVTLGGG